MIRIAWLAVMMAAFIAIAPAFRGTNCGGNSAALNLVKNCMYLMQIVSEETSDRRFDLARATASRREELSSLANSRWLPSGQLLVSGCPRWDRPSGGREVVVVYGTPYRNVPRRLLIPAPPTHAAAFSDGTVGLISVAEFQALDRAAFAPLDELLAASRP